MSYNFQALQNFIYLLITYILHILKHTILQTCLYLDTKSHYKNEGDLVNEVLALALTRAMLNLPHSPDTAY